MRVLYLVPDLIGPPGGISRYSRLVCRALAETGTEVEVHALHDTQTAPPAFLASSTIHYSSHAGSRPAFVASVLRSAARRRYDILLTGHVHFGPLAWGAARATGARFGTFVYGIEAWSRLPLPRRRSMQHADRVIAISQYTANRVVMANGVAREKICILHNCLDPTFDSPPDSETARPRPSLLTVARLVGVERYKGHHLVIRALPALLTRHPDLVYDVVGGGDDRLNLEKLADELGVSRAVRFHGIVSEEELRRRYMEADVFVMPSQAEGFGFVYLEAMAHGKPVIAGNRDAAPEVIQDGVTGCLIDPTSESQLVEAVSDLLNNPDLRCRMGKAAAERVREEFGFPQFRSHLQSYLLEMSAHSGSLRGQ